MMLREIPASGGRRASTIVSNSLFFIFFLFFNSSYDSLQSSKKIEKKSLLDFFSLLLFFVNKTNYLIFLLLLLRFFLLLLFYSSIFLYKEIKAKRENKHTFLKDTFWEEEVVKKIYRKYGSSLEKIFFDVIIYRGYPESIPLLRANTLRETANIIFSLSLSIPPNEAKYYCESFNLFHSTARLPLRWSGN